MPKRSLLILAAGSILTLLLTSTLRNYHYASLPPIWDNLVYQIQALKLFRALADAQWHEVRSFIGSGAPLGYTASLAAGFSVFGLHSYAPYVVGMIFAWGCTSAVFLLSRKLGTTEKAAFRGALFFGLLPNFIYQNFFQTRNDFPAAMFAAFAWIALLEVFTTASTLGAFGCGALFGVSILMKLSMPGYIMWGILLFLLLPYFTAGRLSLILRIRLCVWIGLGILLTCGWHYVPALSETLAYFSTWTHMKAWQNTQYGLNSFGMRLLFYPKNLIFVHLWGVTALMLALILFSAACILLRRQSRSQFVMCLSRRDVQFVVASILLPMAFLTFNGSLASIGDIPILIPLAALVTVMVSKALDGVLTGVWHRRISLAALIVVAPLSFVRLPYVHLEGGRDFQVFSAHMRALFDRFDLHTAVGFNVYSNPIYNLDTLQWSWLMDSRLASKTVSMNYPHLSLYKEDPVAISEELETLDYLLMSPVSMLRFGGEKFHTLNRWQQELNDKIIKSGRLKLVDRFYLEDRQLPVQLYLNNDFVHLKLSSATPASADAWVEWGSAIEVMALRPLRLQLRGILGTDTKRIFLTSAKQKIPLKLISGRPGDECVFESEVLEPTVDGKIVYTLESESTVPLNSADSRHLAFRDLKLGFKR